ncbi:uncharacterized protein LOC118732866, partial [Rhagoletis pomonella]|uniref:uncharacterized protein LOC118732866 n=1 Tax=Rhagoletis pomonella TaxID=28610 RepID=UPI0017821EE4
MTFHLRNGKSYSSLAPNVGPRISPTNRQACTKCSGHSKESPQYLAFNSVNTTIVGRSCPLVHIEMFGLKGEALFDTGAKTSVASANLKKILSSKGCVFQDVMADVTLADGSTTAQKVLSTICDITIGHRVRKIRMISLSNATKNRTLIGADFLEQAGIVVNMAQRYWYFEDEPKVKFDFAKPSVSGLPSAIDIAGAHVVTSNRLSPRTKAVNEYSNFVRYVMRSGTNIDDAVSPEISPERNYGPAVKEKRSHSNDYSPHSVQQIFKSSLPVGESTPENSSRLFAPPIKVKISGYEEFCEENFFPLNSLELSPPTQTGGCDLTLEQRRDLDKLLLEHNEVFEESTFATPF